MAVPLSHPDGPLLQSDHAPVALATGSRLVLLAGQVAVTPAGGPTSTNLADHVHPALQDVATGVRGAGRDVRDIAGLPSCVVGWTPEMARGLLGGLSRARHPRASAPRCHPAP